MVWHSFLRSYLHSSSRSMATATKRRRRMTRCRLSGLGKRVLNPPAKTRNREGEFLGPDRSGFGSPISVKVLWDGVESVHTYHRDYIEIIDEAVDPPRRRGARFRAQYD